MKAKLVRYRAHASSVDLWMTLMAIAAATLILVLASQAAAAQSFAVIHACNGRGDGSFPVAGPSIDGAGNLYGTPHSGGAHLYGSVFKLTHTDSGWTYTSLYDFCAGGGPYGNDQYGGVVWEITP